MKVLNVGEFKANFSSVLDLVRKGQSISLSYGKNKKKFAVLIPYEEYKKPQKIKLGILKNKASFKLSKDFKITETESLSSF